MISSNKEMKLCSIEDCGRKHYAKGYCKKHYTSFIKYGDPLKVKRSRRLKYEDTHKTIDGIEFKYCKECEEWKQMDSSNFYVSSKTKDGHSAFCKECHNKLSKKWQKENPERYDEIMKRHKETDKFKQTRQIWVEENMDAIRERSRYKSANRRHKITDEEWETCKEYFNYSCAYCGVTEEEHKEKYSQRIHKEHAHPVNVNDLSNCIPSCLMCNTSKGEKTLEEWYRENNSVYSESRKNKIIKWLNGDYKKYKISQ